ncbi:MAG TPA: TolC family protein [Terriglobia bacterium]|nr:TolC family protein [Terriglobia bacterium]
MKLAKMFVSLMLVTMLAVPAMASSDWVDDFLKRYDPARSAPPTGSAGATNAELSQILRTGEMPVTMNDIINMLLDNNLDIRSNRLVPRTAYYQALVFYRALMPSFHITGNIARDVSLSSSQLNGASSRIQDTSAWDTGVSQLLPTGTSFSVDMTMNRLLTNSNNSVFNPAYTSRIIYTVGQHLLQNKGRVVNMRQILEGQYSEKISEANFEAQLTALIVQAQKSYWDLVFATQNLDVTQRSLDTAKRTLDENQQKVEIGTLAPVDLVPTKLQVATVNDQLVQSRFAVTTAADQIKKLVSSDKDGSMFLLNFKTQDLPYRPEAVQIPTLEEAVRIALENRPELRQAQLDLKSKGVEVEYTANQRKPVVDVTASFDQNGLGGTQNRGFLLGQNLAAPIPGGVFSSFGQLFGYGYTGFSAGFNIVIPLSNKAVDSDYERALNDQRTSQTKIDTTASTIVLDVRNALMQVEMYKARIETAKTARELAEQTLQAEQDKFNLGTSTIQFVLNDQTALAQAQSNEVQTQVNFTKAIVDLDRAMGMTLKKNNIELDKTLGNVASKTVSGTSAR